MDSGEQSPAPNGTARPDGSDPPPKSASEWLGVMYDQLRGLAAERLRREPHGHTLEPTALVHEAWLRLAQHADAGGVRDEAHFRALAAQSMRHILIDHARRKRARKRGGDRLRIALDDVASDDTSAAIDLIGLDEALGRLQTIDPRKGRVVELRFFGGMTTRQIADVLEISPKTAEADWYMARAWLRTQLASAG